MSRATHAALTSSVNPNWRTPQWLYDALHAEFTFGLDAAASTTDALHERFLGPGGLLDNALGPPIIPWADIAYPWAVFMNPPYCQGQPIDPWVERAAVEGRTTTVVGLIPYSPQTRWWRRTIAGVGPDAMGQATEIRRFPYRLKFDPPSDYVGRAPGANVNTAVAIWRPSQHFLAPWAPFERYYDPRGAVARVDPQDPD